MTRIEFTVPAVPVAQPRPRAVSFHGKARMYNPSTADGFKASVGLAFQKVWLGGPLDGAIDLTVTFFMPRTKGQMWKRKPMPRMQHTKKPDIDNLLKSVMDALTGLAWVDDTQIVYLRSAKWIAAGGEQPRVEVIIDEVM